MRAPVKNFKADRSANIAIMSALILPLALMTAGAGVDFQRWGQQKARLQEFADTLALRGAREFMLSRSGADRVRQIVESIASGGLASELDIAPFTVNVGVNEQEASVTVDLAQAAPEALILSHFSPYGENIEVRATAVARGGMNVCVIALDESGSGAVSTDGDARLEGKNCSVLSNSISQFGIVARRKSEIRAGMICSSGGASGSTSNFSPAPVTDCPVYPDPLAGREPPPVGPCDHNDFRVGRIAAVVSGLPLIKVTVSPGVYCGGLRIEMLADVAFEPGIYVIKDGPLEVGANSTLTGENIVFHLIGDGATFTFNRDSTISMTAPKDGPLAGILFFEDRSAPEGRVHLIASDDARKFIGAFYLPRGVLRVDTNQAVADASAYTAIVARRIELGGKPTLVLNSNYAATDVPTPEGVGPVGAEVFLRD